MPIYEFYCKACTHIFEELCKIGTQPEQCPRCGAIEIFRKVSKFAAQTNASEGMKQLGGGGHQCGSCHGGNCGSCH